MKHNMLEASPRMLADMESDKMDERDDCVVKAIAIATGVSYKKAHGVCRYEGRLKGQGMTYHPIIRALEKLAPIAYQYLQHEHRIGGVNSLYVNTRQSKSVKTLSRMAKSVGAKRLTFNRLPDVIRKDKKYVVMNHAHCVAVVDGKIQDWSAGSKMLVTELIELK